MEATKQQVEHFIVSELDHDRIASLREEGFFVARIVPNYFGNESCFIDGFVMLRHSNRS